MLVEVERPKEWLSMRGKTIVSRLQGFHDCEREYDAAGIGGGTPAPVAVESTRKRKAAAVSVRSTFPLETYEGRVIQRCSLGRDAMPHKRPSTSIQTPAFDVFFAMCP